MSHIFMNYVSISKSDRVFAPLARMKWVRPKHMNLNFFYSNYDRLPPKS